MITDLARTRFTVMAIQKDMGVTRLEVYSCDNIKKPIYRKRLSLNEQGYAEAFMTKIKKSFDQTDGKRR